MAYMFT